MGEASDFGRCTKRIYSGDAWSGYPCSRKAVGPHGFCGVHSPEAVARRKLKSVELYAEQRRQDEARYAADRFRRYAHDFYEALKKIADGHDDPMLLAHLTIKDKAPPT